MKLVVTTSKSVLLVDTCTTLINEVERGHGVYYGIAQKHGALYIGARNATMREAINSGREQIRVFNSAGFLESIEAPLVHDSHQITWIHDELWITSSGNDAIVSVGPNRNWNTMHPWGDCEKDSKHINSLLQVGDTVLALCHNWHDPSEVWTLNLMGEPIHEPIKLGNKAHNLWVDDDTVFTLSSDDECAIGTDGTRVPIPDAFVRGYAETDIERCVGCSPISIREGREIGDPTIRIFDESWQLVGWIRLPGQGQILDLQELRIF